ncbi:serpin family protein [Thermogemmata fonticola]|uniref:Serpin family protein n=1 Tax=Thermogemmata fonticola TaxID=2755323 RepID=A0A7V8VH35_9BACT|nr:serpin family protein [Thermogemmata fonticola]MBA2227770.1 serpin family protein [Thermogemmata fonticola]
MQRKPGWYPTCARTWGFGVVSGLVVSLAVIASPRGWTEEPRAVPQQQLRPLVEGNTRFAFNLYAQLVAKDPKGNHFLSPFSISTALAMAAAGARGETQAEMIRTLHLPDQAYAAFGALLRDLNGGDPAKRGFTLSTANALWAQQGYPWRAEYKKLLQQDFRAGLFDVDFISEPEQARNTINKWVENETREKIKDLIPPRAITPLTRAVLTNAIYFKGDWLSQFDKKKTQEQPFTRLDGSQVKVPLMYQSNPKDCLYAETPDLQVLDLPYVGKRLSMTILLPRKHDGLPDLEKQLSAEKLTQILGALRPAGKVEVFLPHFRLEMQQPYLLNEPLKALGIKKAFTTKEADFSGMHSGPEKLFISHVLHKAFVEVNEEGTEAAAATAIVFALSATRPTPKIFRADRPFLFLIRDQQTGSILFLGRLVDPPSSQK